MLTPRQNQRLKKSQKKNNRPRRKNLQRRKKSPRAHLRKKKKQELIKAKARAEEAVATVVVEAIGKNAEVKKAGTERDAEVTVAVTAVAASRNKKSTKMALRP